MKKVKRKLEREESRLKSRLKHFRPKAVRKKASFLFVLAALCELYVFGFYFSFFKQNIFLSCFSRGSR